MRYVRMIALLLVPLVLMSLTGCGSGSSGTTTAASNPFNPGSGGGTPTTPTGTTAAPVFSLKLTTDVSTIDVNSGTVLAKATLIALSAGTFLDPSTGQQTSTVQGSQIPNWPVAFTILAGPATLTPPALPVRPDPNTVNTDSNGLAIMPITSGNTLTTTNVLVLASTTVNGQLVTAVTSFQIVRGGGVIMFTSAAGATPGSQSTLPLTPGDKTVDPAIAPAWIFEQPIPFKVTDSNGNPRVGVPVTLSVYSIIGNPAGVTIDFLVPPITEPNQQTVTTDSAGQGIFNVAVTLTTPPAGGVNVENIVFKATTNDAIPVTAYVGNMYTLTSSLPPLTIAPNTATFGTATDLTFNVAGGVLPYNVTSSNTSRVTATLQADGHTVIAHLVDTTAWTGSVIISATDSRGQIASATVTR